MNELSTNGLNGLSVNIFPCNEYFLNELFANVHHRCVRWYVGVML